MLSAAVLQRCLKVGSEMRLYFRTIEETGSQFLPVGHGEGERAVLFRQGEGACQGDPVVRRSRDRSGGGILKDEASVGRGVEQRKSRR